VQFILSHIAREFGSLANVAVKEDRALSLRGERPPMIGGYVPDVYVTNVPTTFTVIGEAKTRKDLETEHSQAQVRAFLRFLAHTSGGVFILSVPLAAGATARRIVNIASKEIPSPPRTIVLDGMQQRTGF
jgi:ATP-dependent helicase YprA (DUF1998 family)